MALERKGPVLRRPFAHVVEAVSDLFRRHPVGLIQDHVLPDVDPPWVILVPAGRAPDRGVVLIHRRGDRDGGRKPHPAGDVVEKPVAHAHRLDAPAVAALEALDRKAVLAGLAEIIRRADDHPVLGGPAAAGLSLAPGASRSGGPLSFGRRGLFVVGHGTEDYLPLE